MLGVVKVMGDPCTYRLWCTDEKGLALVCKSTGWMKNSAKIAKVLDRKCTGGHRHCNRLPAGAHKTRAAERCPIRHVNAVLQASRQEVRERCQLSAMEAGQHVDEADVC